MRNATDEDTVVRLKQRMGTFQTNPRKTANVIFCFQSDTGSKLEIASQYMPLEQPPRETPQLKCQGVEHQELYLEQYT